jgi:hypothetical protein
MLDDSHNCIRIKVSSFISHQFIVLAYPLGEMGFLFCGEKMTPQFPALKRFDSHEEHGNNAIYRNSYIISFVKNVYKTRSSQGSTSHYHHGMYVCVCMHHIIIISSSIYHISSITA